MNRMSPYFVYQRGVSIIFTGQEDDYNYERYTQVRLVHEL